MFRTETWEASGSWFEKAETNTQLMTSLLPWTWETWLFKGKVAAQAQLYLIQMFQWPCNYSKEENKPSSGETLTGCSGNHLWTVLIYSSHFTAEETEAERMPMQLPGELVADLGFVSEFPRPSLRMLPEFALGTFLLSLASWLVTRTGGNRPGS